MERITVQHGEFVVTVQASTVLMGMTRTRLKMEARKAAETDVDRRWLREFVYPDLIASVVEHQGFETWPPDFETFAALPEAFGIRWETATYDLNPHWLPGYTETNEKKASASPENSIDG
jgi:hypothetical protein